jgi:hypothetical protein
MDADGNFVRFHMAKVHVLELGEQLKGWLDGQCSVSIRGKRFVSTA